MSDAVADLLAFLDAGPTPYHAVAETRRRLDAAGYAVLDEGGTWSLTPGQRAYVVRSEGSIVAFELGTEEPAAAGFRMVGAHTDSPNLRLKPHGDRVANGLRQVVVEPYGGVLLYTWFDRDCSLAGRVRWRGQDGMPRTSLVDWRRPLLRVPSLAIHLQRELAEQGFKPDSQRHLQPLLGLADAPDVRALLLEELAAQGERVASILAWDLMLYDVQRAARAGAREAFVQSARLDNLASCHAALTALLAAGGSPAPFTRLVAFWDHEEVGSRSAQGAGGTFLPDILGRITGGGEALRRAVARSTLISADMAHGVHPNYADRHDPEHLPVLGRGPVVKWNVNQSYTTDAVTAGFFATLCERADVSPQAFVSRNDLRCGTTIGPISAALLGVRSVDVGNPMLSMHSCREMCAAADVAAMIRVLRAGFEVEAPNA